MELLPCCAQPWLQELPQELLLFNAVGMVFMAMDSGTLIDNIVLSNDVRAAQAFARETFWVRDHTGWVIIHVAED